MKNVLYLGLLVVALAAVQAYPTLAGPTGLGVLPTADVVGNGVLDVAADFYDSDDSTVPIRVLYGIGGNFEIGASFRPGDQNTEQSPEEEFPTISNRISDMWGVNAKWRTGWTPLGFCWSLGAQYLQGDFNQVCNDDVDEVETDLGDYKAFQAYFVGTRNFSDMFPCPPSTVIRGHIGVNWTKIQFNFNEDIMVDDVDEDAFRVFGGLDVTFNNKLAILADVQSEDEDLGESDVLYSVAARYPFSPNLAGQIGVTDEIGGVLGSDNSNFFVGLDYAFCTGGATY